MNIQKLNEIATNDELSTKKLYELTVDRTYFVTALKPATTNTSQLILAELDYEFLVYLPERVSDVLYKEYDFLDNLMNAANKFALTMTYLGNSNMKFSM